VILRVAAALALVIAGLAVLGYLHLVGRGPGIAPALRHLRAMKQRTAAPGALAPFTFADFARLPHGAPLAAYAPLERRGVSLEGYVSGMLRSSDGDIHLEVAAEPHRFGDHDLPYVTAEITPEVRTSRAPWRFEALRQAFRPVDRPAFDRPTAKVRISGWLLYDLQYDGLPDTSDVLRAAWDRMHPGRHGFARRHSIAPRLTGWEIHPVTDIELWDDSLGWRRLGS
jgi:hypothetical protein